MTDKWIGKIAVVTGTSSGVGASIFRDFAKAGIITIGLARRVEKVEEIIKELENVKAYAYKCDVSDEKSVTETFKAIEEKFGFIHILVNNAGVGRNTPVLDDDEESYRKLKEILDTNVRGLTQCTREAFRLMKKSDDYGMIININSWLGHVVPFMGMYMSMYSASKYAVRALSETMRQELIIQNNNKIRVANVSSGYIRSGFIEAAGFDEATVKAIDDFPFVTGDDVSNGVMYLLSTGYNVNVTQLTIRPIGEKL